MLSYYKNALPSRAYIAGRLPFFFLLHILTCKQ